MFDNISNAYFNINDIITCSFDYIINIYVSLPIYTRHGK